MSKVDVAIITTPRGLNLFGTFHYAEQPVPELPAVVLLSPGIKMRVGPGRLYVPLTKALNELGFSVLRFDFYGLGDSGGEIEESMLADVYNHIEVGRYVDDTHCALQWLSREHGNQRFILGGLCGGAITALLAAEKDPRIEAILSLGMTVTLASNAATPAKYLTKGQLTSLRQGYYQRLLQPKSWIRLLTFRSDYTVIWRSLAQLLSGKGQHKPAATNQDTIQQQQSGNANPLFPKAYLSFLERGGRVLMLFSGADRLRHEYEEKFAVPFAQSLGPFSAQIHNHVVPNANHVLSFYDWKQEMVDVSRKWLADLYGGLPNAEAKD